MERLVAQVAPRSEYSELIHILRNPASWKEGHNQFSKIRKNISLANDYLPKNAKEEAFIHIAENAAKVAYNCSGEPAPFDNNSFDRLLKSEKTFENI